VPDSVEYEHVQLIAKVLPSREAINEVERIAKSFWGEHPNKFIGVHCAYGGCCWGAGAVRLAAAGASSVLWRGGRLVWVQEWRDGEAMHCWGLLRYGLVARI